MQSGKNIVEEAEDIVLHTHIDSQYVNYPIYIYKDENVYKISYRATQNEILATFHFKSFTKINAELSHELLEIAKSAIRKVTLYDANVEKLELEYEIYHKRYERKLFDAKAYVIKLTSICTPFSDTPQKRKTAWAIGYNWKRRISAIERKLEKYTFVEGKEDRTHDSATVRICIKLPIILEEFKKIFNIIVSKQHDKYVSTIAELETEIEQTEKLIKQKRHELQELEEKLAQLRMKLQTEKMKLKLIEIRDG